MDPCSSLLAGFGPWQLRTFLVVALVKIPSAWHMANILFTAPSPAPNQFWCARPRELQHWDVQSWRNISQPDKNHMDPCNVYDAAYEMFQEWHRAPTSLPSNTSTRPCEHFEFLGENTVVIQWHLVCEREVLVSVSQFFYLLGILVGGVLCTKLLTRYSPRSIILVSMVIQIIAGVGVAFSPHLELQVFLRFITAVACANMFTTGYIICTDITVGRCRLIIGSCYEHFWSIGIIALPYLSSLFSDWRHLQLAISLPTIIIFLGYRWIPESPIWLINMGREEDAKDVLKNVLQVNKDTMQKIDILPQSLKRESINTDVSWCDLVKWRYFALHVTWATTVVTYYGALLNIKNIGEQLILNTAIAGIAEIAGVLLGLIFMLWCSQKWAALGVTMIVGGSACLLSWLLPLEKDWSWQWAMLALAMTGRIAIACSLTLLTVTSSELLPLSYRKLGIFSSVTIARLCLLSAPFIGSLAMFGNCVSLSAFGGLTILGGMSSLLLALPGDFQKKICCKPKVQTIWNADNATNTNSHSYSVPMEGSFTFNHNLNGVV